MEAQMQLAKALGRRVHPMMVVVPLVMLGIGPALTLMFVAFSVLFIAAWVGGELFERLGVGVDPQASIDATRGLDWGPTRW
jgi:uncharacterized membrane protein